MFKKLKSLFIHEDENQTKESESQIEETQSSVENDETSQSASFTPSPGSKPDEKFVDLLLKAIENNNIEGFDYLEYKQSLQSLAKMDMDEATRFKSAFAMAKTMGATPEKLIKAAGFYVTVLEQENKKFSNAVNNQMNTQVKGRETAVLELQNSIKLKNAKIEELKKEIEASNKELEIVKSEISGAAEKVKQTEANFQYAYKSVLKQIVEDMEKMKNYLK